MLGCSFMRQPLAAADDVNRRPSRDSVPGSTLFNGYTVHSIQIDISPDALDTLRRQPRDYVTATVRVDREVYTEVGVHLKGSTGSFRDLDDKPALTVDFNQFNPGQKLDGLSKIHLNNSVEDASYVNERLGSELFRAAGVPTPRVAHTLVELNGRSLGLYVLKEGFSAEFLGLYFRRTDGNLYDIGSGNEVTERMKRNSGAGPNDWSDLKALAAAAQQPDLAQRWQQLQRVLDMDRFLSFVATEILIGHRDGYSLARNNFRIYHDPTTDKFVFLPHGMDILFSRSDLSLQPRLSGLVAQAVLEIPEGRRRYLDRLGTIFTNVFNAAALTHQVDELVAAVRPHLATDEARSLANEADLVKERILRRTEYAARALREPEVKPLRFEQGMAKPGGWRPVDPPAGGKLELATAPDGKPALCIQAGPFTAASWRTKVLLKPGRYRFEGVVQLRGVVPLAFGKSKGAGLRVSPSKLARPHQLTGTVTATPLAVEFTTIKPVEEIELICELRASKGECWFDSESLRLVQLK
jgi:hypothetical protein